MSDRCERVSLVGKDRNYGPAVDPSTRALRYTSASAIATFNVGEYGGCPTRWWRRYVGGEKEPKGKALELGSDIHAQLEHYLTTTSDALGKIARPGKRFLPVPGPDLGVEVPIDEGRVTAERIAPGGYTLAGVSIVGSIDLLNMRGSYVDSFGELLADPVGTIEVHDHKTTSSMSRAKTPPQLLEVSQMPLYGEFVRRKYAGLSFIRLSHLYMLTDGAPMARKSSILAPVAVIQRRAEQIEQLIVEMGQVAQIEKVVDVPKCPNAGAKDSACQSFGRGCPFKDRCFSHLNAMTRLRMSFIKKAIATGKSAAPSTPAAQTQPPAGIPLPPVISLPPTATQVAPTPGLVAVTYSCQAIAGQPYVVGETNVISIGENKFIPTAGGAPMTLRPADVIIPGAIPAHASAGLVPPPKPVASTAASDAVAAVGEVITSVKRGRKPKAVEAEAPAACACGTALSPENSSTKDGKTTHIGCSGPAVGGTAPDGLHLFIGCIPSMQYTLLDDYVAERVAEVNKAFGLIDPRISQSNEDANAFGKWKALIGETVRQTPPAPGRFVAFSYGSELTTAVVDALIPLCSTIVRGVR